MSYLRRGAQGMIVVFSLGLIANFIGYLTRTFLARALSPEEFGLFYSAFSVLMFVGIFCGMGFGEAMPQYIATYLTKKEYRRAAFSFWYSLLARMVLSGICIAIIWPLAGSLANSYFKHPLGEPLLKILLIMLPLLLLSRSFHATFQGFQRPGLMGLLASVEKILFLAALGIHYLAIGRMDPVTAGIDLLLASLGTTLVFGPIALSMFSRLSSTESVARIHLAKNITTFGFYSLLSSVSFMVLGYIDVIMLTHFRSLTEVGVYNTLLPTVIVLSFLGKSIFAVFFPMVSELWAKGHSDKIAQGVQLLQRYSLYLMIPIMAGVFSYPSLIITILFGAKYSSGASALRILSFTILFYSLSQVYQNTLLGMGHPRLVTRSVIIVSVFNTLMNLVLIPSQGIVGAAISTTLSYLFILVITFRDLRTFISLPALGLVIRSMILLIAVLGTIAAIQHLIEASIILEVSLAIIAAALIYVALGYLLGAFNHKEILKLISLASRQHKELHD